MAMRGIIKLTERSMCVQRRCTRPVLQHVVNMPFSADCRSEGIEESRQDNLERPRVRRSLHPSRAQRRCMDEIKQAALKRNWVDSRKVFAKALSRSDARSFVDLHLYNAIIDAAAQCRKPIIAVNFLPAMKKRGITPDVLSYNLALKACGDSEQWEQMLALVTEMLNEGVLADGASFTWAVMACGKVGQWEMALSLLKEIRKRGVTDNVVSYKLALKACGDDGQWRQALSLLREMQKEGVPPDVGSCNSVSKACGDDEQLEQTLSLLKEMLNEDASVFASDNSAT